MNPYAQGIASGLGPSFPDEARQIVEHCNRRSGRLPTTPGP
ncbi:hypothetical protein [Streptomyces sp. NPDC002559]